MWPSARRLGAGVGDERRLPGRAKYDFPLAEVHEVLTTAMLPPYPDGIVTLYLAMGCFWGAEKRLWGIPGVHTTAVGYMGGATTHPTYEEVCTGQTGHTEAVLVAYDPTRVRTLEILRMFWENHDPTQGMRQGNDTGTQYRSAAYWTTDEQRELLTRSAAAYGLVLRAEGFDPITTELAAAQADSRTLLPFYFAEKYHQQYLAPTKNPHGYDCHAHTGMLLPELGE